LRIKRGNRPAAANRAEETTRPKNSLQINLACLYELIPARHAAKICSGAAWIAGQARNDKSFHARPDPGPDPASIFARQHGLRGQARNDIHFFVIQRPQ
jgi:hypothetical protein